MRLQLGAAMAVKNNRSVRMYLSRAAHAYERAIRSEEPQARALYNLIYSRWMNEAAALALHKNVDLFELSKRIARLPPSDTCMACRRRMELIANEAPASGRTWTFRCAGCAIERIRPSQSEKLRLLA